jgi:glycyl-tRNA synthetase beta chain
MPELLLEIFCEEIPARMQGQAARDLQRLVTDGLTAQGFAPENARAFATPRRLALVIEGLDARQPDMREERKGPRTNAPDAALQGFLKSTGLAKDQLTIQADPKGDFYLAIIERNGRPTSDVIAQLIPEIMRTFPWPKSMRVGDKDYTWVRPIHSILCLFAGAVVPFAFGGVKSGDATQGHRFLSEGQIHVRNFDYYQAALRKAHVILDSGERAQIVHRDALAAAKSEGLEVIEDAGLLDEVAGLVEWPVVLVGQFDKTFLAVPPEVLTTTMRANQKYFALRDPKTGQLANKFLLVANMITKDDGKAVINGNERVLRARLSDAKFFWDQDLKIKLEDRVPLLNFITFYDRLGSQLERSTRIQALADWIAIKTNANRDHVRRAAILCKADLVSSTVGEFPEVQGAAGRHIALFQGENVEIASAIFEHYKPVGPAGDVPKNPVSVAVGLADKLDTITGFFSINEKPTGSKDPFALRRAAIGAIRTIIESKTSIRLRELLVEAFDYYHDVYGSFSSREVMAVVGPGDSAKAGARQLGYRFAQNNLEYSSIIVSEPQGTVTAHQEMGLAASKIVFRHHSIVISEILDFFADRLKFALKDKGIRHDLIDAVFALEGQDDLVLIVRRVEALQSFLSTPDGTNLLAGYKRASNILKAERKKEKKDDAFTGPADNAKLASPEERALFLGLAEARTKATTAIGREDFASAMAALAKLRPAVDAFFEKVTVNDPDPALRENRLRLLNQFPMALAPVADFTKIEG